MSTLVALLATCSFACSASVPTKPDDACAIFDEHRSWYKDTRKSYERWGVPISVQLAVIRQESSFRAKAKPPRRRILWIFPGPRPSSAYGYAQVLDGTWKSYKRSTGRGGADRDDFGDAADFVGWYGATLARKGHFAKSDAYRLYLSYHEGGGGYRRRTYEKKPWLMKTAGVVQSRARRYQTQLNRCESRLRRRRWFFGLF